jgi:hypothetical protein
MYMYIYINTVILNYDWILSFKLCKYTGIKSFFLGFRNFTISFFFQIIDNTRVTKRWQTKKKNGEKFLWNPCKSLCKRNPHSTHSWLIVIIINFVIKDAVLTPSSVQPIPKGAARKMEPIEFNLTEFEWVYFIWQL